MEFSKDNCDDDEHFRPLRRSRQQQRLDEVHAWLCGTSDALRRPTSVVAAWQHFLPVSRVQRGALGKLFHSDVSHKHARVEGGRQGQRRYSPTRGRRNTRESNAVLHDQLPTRFQSRRFGIPLGDEWRESDDGETPRASVWGHRPSPCPEDIQGKRQYDVPGTQSGSLGHLNSWNILVVFDIFA